MKSRAAFFNYEWVDVQILIGEKFVVELQYIGVQVGVD